MRLSVASLVLFAFLACGDDVMVDGGTVNPATVRDQSGAVFNWDCDADGGCVVSRMGDRPPLPDCPDPDAPPDYKYAAGSFFEVIGACVLGQDGAAWTANPTWGRYLTCEVDTDCPQLLHSEPPGEYACRVGFCRSDAVPLDRLPGRVGMLSLCYGGTPRSPGATDYPADIQAKIAANCPENAADPCEQVPLGCPDPRP